MNNVYITTAIPYVNAAPHLGFALELVLADALARSYRQQGCNVRFCTGTDENSLKNVLSAQAATQPVAEFVAHHASEFRDLTQTLLLSTDDFVRTSTDPRHLHAVHSFWQACERNGDIYRGTYEGWYCIGCEAFLSARDVVDGACPEHAQPLQRLREDNHFFRLSRYADALRDLIDSRRLHIRPEHRRQEVLAMLNTGVSDFSISRPRWRALGWGIPVPDDPNYVIYVWFDALVNYLSSLGYPDDGSLLNSYWHDARVIHVLGKGISRFHALYWPAMLLSAGLPAPDELWIHGYVTVHGEKISKSAANSVAPSAAAALLGADALRYYLLQRVGSDHDGDFSVDALQHAYEHELADTLGNLCSRSLAMVQRYRGGRALEPTASPTSGDAHIRSDGDSLLSRVHAALQHGSASAATQLVLDHARLLNAFVNERAPWRLAKEPASAQLLDECLATLLHGLRVLADAMVPFLPNQATALDRLLTARPLTVGEPLFPKPNLRGTAA